MNWKDIKDAPKDGTTVWLCWMDDDIPNDIVQMHYDCEMTNGLFGGAVGMWSSRDGGFTWFDGDPDGAPTHFAPVVYN